MWWFEKLFVADYLIHCKIEVFMILIDFFELGLLALGMLHEFLHLFVSLFTDIHYALFLFLMIFKGLLSTLCV